MRFPFPLKRFVALGAVLLVLPLSACGFIYHAEEIEGWVVDAETGKPLEGVIVVAHWQLRATSLAGGGPAIRELQIYETVTDRNGRYFFPAWGPKFAVQGELGGASPALLYFKPGYKFLGLDNEWYRGMDTTKSDWDKKTVKLEPFKGTLAEYAEHLSSRSSTLWVVGFEVGDHSGDYCGWKNFPRLLRALDELDAKFRAAGIVQGTVVSRLKANDNLIREKGCGSVLDALKGVTK